MSLNGKTCKIAFALAALVFAVGIGSGPSSRAAQLDLPEGPGVEIARAKCLNCHEADLIVAQRLSRQGWTREVEKMVRWGAVVTDAEKEPLVDYFAARFTPRPAAAPAPAGAARGKEIFDARCLLCHETDLVVAQRLSRQGWTREVEKMVRWGAVVADAEKEPLVDYLFSNYGPKRK
ncbi:MAG: hypothetical protein SF339_09380 [Blastocatellia bacterium]|nr:hypothetical protein [Blastocatellia bacterium]